MQGFVSASGVVLRRQDSPEGNRSLYVLLKGMGPFWITAMGAGKGHSRLGGATEPLVWGLFHLYKGPTRYYLREMDVKDDLWPIRTEGRGLRRALTWNRLISELVLPQHPCDDLLAHFYWTLHILADGGPRLFSPLEWRFLWRWLHLWGRAPDFRICSGCGRSLSSSSPALLTEQGILCPLCPASAGMKVFLPSLFLQELRSAAILPRDDFLQVQLSQNFPKEWDNANRILESILRRTY
jgi:DNA repair protein RecO (recombination protein O)